MIRSHPRGLFALMFAILVLILPLAGPLIAVNGAAEAPTGEGAFKPGEILVAFKSDVSAASMNGLFLSYHAFPAGTVFGSKVQVLRVPEGRELALIHALEAHPAVRYAEPNYVYKALDTSPNDPFFYKQWAYTKINAIQAWDLVTGSTSITVAVIDSGIDSGHPDLVGKIVGGYDFVDGDAIPNDLHGHGTHVAGTVAAATNNNIGVAGTAWGAKIMPLKVLDANGEGSTSDVASAINWAKVHGAKVINLSLGGPDVSQTLQDAITAAHNAGLLVVAAMGNKNSEQPFYPAACAYVMAVAATNRYDLRAYYSNYGVHCDIAAPGGAMSYCHDAGGIYSTLPTYNTTLTGQSCYNANYDMLQGTSQATPFVSGLAALVWSVDPSLTPDEVQQIIETTAVDLGAAGWDKYYGYGRIDALAAVRAAAAPGTPTLTPMSDPDHDATYLVDWSDEPKAEQYRLEEDDNPGFTTPQVRYTGANSQVTITAQSFGTWYYRVRAERPSFNVTSDWSNTEHVDIGLDAPVLLPINNGGQDTYQVSWQAVTGAAGYWLQESRTLDFSSPMTYTVGISLSYQVVGREGGTWYYRVRAYNAVGSSGWSAIRSATVISDPPLLAPITAVEPDAYVLKWSSSVGATAYRLQEASDISFTTLITRYLGLATSYTVTGQPNGEWYYRVAAYNQAGFSVPSNIETATVSVASIPSPVLLPISNTERSSAYSVEWSAVDAATSYTLEESLSPYFYAPTVVYTGPYTSYSVSGQSIGTWSYRVRAQGASGRSPWSNSQSVLVSAHVYLPLTLREVTSH